MNEVSLVLKSVTILIAALKDAQKTSVAKSEACIWFNVHVCVMMGVSAYAYSILVTFPTPTPPTHIAMRMLWNAMECY